KFNKLAHHLVAAHELGDGEHQVGRGDALAQLAAELHTHHVRGQHVHRLAQHGRFGLDTAHAPPDDANAVDHGGVAVGADQRVGVIHAVLALMHAARQVFEVDLVNDAKTRGN